MHGLLQKIPGKVSSLILANTLYKLPEEAKPLFEERLKLVEKANMAEIASFIAELSIHQKREDLKDFIRTILRKNDKEFYRKVTIEMRKINFEDVLPKINIPTLILVAECNHSSSNWRDDGKAYTKLRNKNGKQFSPSRKN